MITRLFYLAIAIAGGWLLGMGMYIQYARGIADCGPVVLIRYGLVAVAVLAVFAIVLNAGKTVRWTVSALIGLVSLAGAWVAAHEAWSSHLPSPAKLGIRADSLVAFLPLENVLPRFFSGAGECASGRWNMIGLPFAQWCTLFFVLFVILAIAAARRD
ncbi:MAG: disulfide bond formation protein B [Burkholderiales bacterium]